jgi:hypothetical protein
MDPKKNKLWSIMRNITSTYYYIDKFDRVQDSKFIEDSMELSKIGYEIFENFNFKDKDIYFIDICGAPGMYSKILVEEKKGTGIGVSLPPEKGGVEFTFSHDNYKIYYKDILEKEYIIESKHPLNLGIASCVSYKYNDKKAHMLNMELIMTSMKIIFSNLGLNGNMIINMSIKNIYTCYNILDLLLKIFDNITLWKSSIVWGTKNTFYIFCYGFKKTDINMDNIIDKIKNENSDFNNKYLGNIKDYNTITKMLNEIYITRINCWLKKISSEDLHKARD